VLPELPSLSSFLPFNQFHRHFQKFLFLLRHHLRVRHAPPALRSTIASFLVQIARLTPCPQNEHTCRFQTRAAFSWLWSSGKGWFPDSSSACHFLILIPCKSLPLLHVIVIAVEHQYILPSFRREYCRLNRGGPHVVTHLTPSSGLDENPRRGGSVAAQGPGPTVRRKMFSRRPSCSMSKQWTFSDCQPVFLLNSQWFARIVRLKKILRLVIMLIIF